MSYVCNSSMARSKFNYIILLLIFLVSISVVSATTFYVAPGGNDSAVGDEANPWETIGTHLNGATHTNIGSADIMFVKNGTYNEPEGALTGLYTTSGGTIIGEDRDAVIVHMIGTNANGFYPDDTVLNLYNMTISSEVVNGADNTTQIKGLNLNEFYEDNPTYTKTRYGTALRSVTYYDEWGNPVDTTSLW